MKIKKRFFYLLLAVCLTVGLVSTVASAANTSGTNSDSGISLAVARGEYLTSIWYSAAVAEIDNSMSFLLGSVPTVGLSQKKAADGDSYIAKLTNFGYSDSLYSTVRRGRGSSDGITTSDFSKGYGAEIGTGTTYKVGDTTYGTTQPDIFNNTGWYSNYKTGVLYTEDFSSDELEACSFSFVPVGTNHDDGYYIFVTHKEYISNEWRDFTFSLNYGGSSCDIDNENETVTAEYKLELRYEATVNSQKYYEERRTVWYIEKADDAFDGEYFVYTKGTVYQDTINRQLGFSDSVRSYSKGCLFLQADSNGLYLDRALPEYDEDGQSEKAYNCDIDELMDLGKAQSIMLYGNLNMLTGETEGTFAGYDAFRLVEDGNVKNIVVKRQGRMINETTGESEMAVVQFPGSDKGNLVMWTESCLYERKTNTDSYGNVYVSTVDKSVPRYSRDFEDYTSSYDGTEAEYEKDHPALSPPTGYTEGQNVYQSQYKGKTFYAIRSFNMNYSVTGLANGNSLDVRMGTTEDDAPFASTMDVKSGTAVTEGNWVAFTLPTANQTGYKYTLESVTVKDSSGEEVFLDLFAYNYGYRVGTLSSGATYIYFKMPPYAISVNISLKRESAPINTSANGYFIIPDNGLKYRSSVTANGLTPVELFLSTDQTGEAGDTWIKIYEYPFNEYCVNNDDYLSYSIASCKWYVKVGEDGEYKELNLGISYESESGTGAHRATSAATYLPLVSEDTKVYYKCEYTIKRNNTGDVSDTKTLVLTANVTNTGSLPQNTLYVCYQDDEDESDDTNTYRSGQSYEVGHWLKFYASTSEVYPKESETIVIIDYDNIGDVENDTISQFTYSFTWYIQPKDGSGSAVALNSTPVTVSPTSKNDLVASYACKLPNLTSQGQTEANIWFEVTKTDKTTGLRTIFQSSDKATLTVVSDYPIELMGYNQSMTASLEKDNVFVNADNIAKWEYSTDNGDTWTDIPLTNRSDRYSDDSYRSAPFTVPISFGHVGVDIYSFTVKTPGVYIFRMTNTAGSVNEVTCDFTKLHTHVWGEKTYYSSQGHAQKCTVAGCGAYKDFGEAHKTDENGFCTICQSAVPVIMTTALPDGTVGTAYSQTLAFNASGNITWSLKSGSTLPAGLSLDSATGVISGTPTEAGTTSFTVKATSSAGSDTQTLSITVVAVNPVKPTLQVTESYTYSGSEQTASVSGYDAETMNISGNIGTDAGDYTVEVTSQTGKWADGSTDAVTITWSIGKATQDAPTGLDSAAPTVEGGSDGKIIGTTDKMEYRAATATEYAACTADETTDLPAGTYFVRYAGDGNHFASSDTAVTIGEGASLEDFIISFDANGGDGIMDSVPVKSGANYTLPACGFTAPEGQQFKAWEIDGTEYSIGNSYTVGADTGIKALWKEIPTPPTVPTLSGGSASRGSKSTGEVKFTSSEEGSYYYAVVEKGAAAPAVDTTGTGTACVSGENVLSLAVLSGTGAKDIYIVVKNAAGTVSEMLKIEIPEYATPEIDPVYSLSADVTSLDFGSVQTGYAAPDPKVVAITNTGNCQITLTQPTANYYVIGTLSKTVLEPGETVTFAVQPKVNLAAKTYDETITMQGAGTSSIGIRLSFTVTASAKPDPTINEGDGETVNKKAEGSGAEEDSTRESGAKEDSTKKNTGEISPQTGDNNDSFLWLAMLFVSGGAITATTLVRKKRKNNR